jgi:hypothetical protein
MFSKSLAIGALAGGCVAAAAGGAYVAVRHNANEPVAVAIPAVPVDAAATSAADTAKPVAETEAVVSSPAGQPNTGTVEPVKSAKADEKPEAPKASPAKDSPSKTRSVRSTTRPAAPAASSPRVQRSPRSEPSASLPRDTRPTSIEPQTPAETPSAVSPRSDVERQTAVELPPAAPQLEHLVVPASSVIGLRVETPLSTERAQVEDRVDARVTRDVMVDGRVAIPSGARAMGSVILVERGGKMKDRARLGVRFHTLVLADGTELPINTEAIYREGDSPSGESARKIGGAAVGGAILGALIGGKKGAVVGGATGAAGGTAVVMAGDRNAATLPTGTIVTIRLAAPVGVEVEKH